MHVPSGTRRAGVLFGCPSPGFVVAALVAESVAESVAETVVETVVETVAALVADSVVESVADVEQLNHPPAEPGPYPQDVCCVQSLQQLDLCHE